MRHSSSPAVDIPVYFKLINDDQRSFHQGNARPLLIAVTS